jgi:nitroreductase
MDVATAIRTRRSVRRYKNKDISESVLKDVLEAARLAPSAANRQAWELIVVRDRLLKQELMPLCKNQKFVEE